MFGLRVRGQHTRTTGRKGGAVGVKKLARPTSAEPSVSATALAAPASTGQHLRLRQSRRPSLEAH